MNSYDPMDDDAQRIRELEIENDALRAELAKRDALLRECRDIIEDHAEFMSAEDYDIIVSRIDAALVKGGEDE